MKYTPLIAALLFAGSASAEVVTATGWGGSFEGALANAKQEALEMGASTFVTGKKQYKNRQITEEIVQYNGGIIKEYDIIRSNKMGDEYSVTISADVVEQDNRVKSNKSFDISDFAEHDRRAKAVDYLDDPGKAIHLQVIDFSTQVKPDGVHVKAQVRLAWQNKWLSDMRAFASVVNEKGVTSTNTLDVIVGNVTNSLIAVNPVGAAVFHEALDPDEVEHSDEQMVCFRTDRKDNTVDCRSIGVDLQKFSSDPKLVMVANGKVIHQKYLYSHLWDKVYPGEYSTNSFFRNHKVTFHQPALVIYTHNVEDAYLEFVVQRHQLEGAKNVEVYLK